VLGWTVKQEITSGEKLAVKGWTVKRDITSSEDLAVLR
jgi:hypothetical protein